MDRQTGRWDTDKLDRMRLAELANQTFVTKKKKKKEVEITDFLGFKKKKYMKKQDEVKLGQIK
jgi:hypothetical protein